MRRMAPTFALLLFVAAAIDAGEPPAPVPSGMDLLYSDRVPVQPTGEPLVTLGIMSGQKKVVLTAPSSMQADFYDGGVLKQTTVHAGEPVELTILRAQAANRRLYVDLEGVPWGKPDRLDRALAGWRARGYSQVEAIEDGTVLGIGGRVIDNREYRVILPVRDARESARIIAEVYRLFGTRAHGRARLAERPWAELEMKVRGVPQGTPTSFVRFNARDGVIGVAGVEYGVGYAWHGFQDRSYRGEVYVVVDPDGRLAVVNVLGAETVLAGVVPAELYPSSPPEALKAQAVAARNQLFAKLGKRHHDDPFQLCSSQHCQVYAGTFKEDPRTTHAVRATAGEVAFHDGRLVDTVYSSTCGGHTEDNEAVWGNAADPALRGRPDFDVERNPELARFAGGITEENLADWLSMRPETFCGLASMVRPEKLRWEKTLSAAELGTRLAGRYDWIGTLRKIAIDERGRGGRVISARLIGTRGEATIVHELPIRQLFGNLNSGAFLVDHHRNEAGELLGVTFVGGGWGHGVGMCQLGAIGRAEAGHGYRRILGHYYNGAAVERLYGVAEAAAHAPH